MKVWKWTRLTAAALAMVTMVASPVAHGSKQADSQKERINEFLRVSKLNSRKPVTVGEFHRRMRLWYPMPTRNLMDAWAARNRDDLMPRVDTSVVKDAEGKEQIRLLFSKNGESITMTTGDGFIRIGKVKVTLADYYNLPALIKRAQAEDPYIAKKTKDRPNPFRQVGTASKIIPSNVEFSRMTNTQRANYLLHLRLTLQVADKIVAIGRTPAPKKTSSLFEPAESLWALLLRGEFACAAGLAGQTCIVAGYISKYDERGRSCGGESEGRADFVSQIQGTLGTFKATKCSGGGSPSGPESFACNPIVYGLSSAGSVHCVPKANIKYATRECNSMSPLDKDGPNFDADRKRIVKSWAEGLGAGISDEDFFKDGEGNLRLKKEKHDLIRGQLDALRAHIEAAQNQCAVEPPREDQKSACAELLKRMFDLQALIQEPKPPEPPPEPPQDCSNISGSTFNSETQTCECSGGQSPNTKDDGSQTCESVTPPVTEPEPPKKEEKKNNWLIPLLVIGGGLLAVCLLWLCKGDKDKKTQVPVPVPPIPPPGPVDPPPVEPPPPPPPPPVVQPPTEGGTGTPPDTSGGVRGSK